MINQAKLLRKKGYSYQQIARQLGIGKTTAFNYVNSTETKPSEVPSLKAGDTHVLSSSEPGRNAVLNVRAEQGNVAENSSQKSKEPPSKQMEIPKEEKPKMPKEFTGNELMVRKFDSLDFKFKFLELIGKPSKPFSAIIWGMPKGGKSNLSIRLADYLQQWHGNVAYIAAEEGESVTMQEKIKAIGGSEMTIVESRDREQIALYLKNKSCDFVFIDSINNARIDNDFLENLKKENPSKSFIAIVQATKGGNFKGDQALTHNCDFIIKVINGIAYHSGRFNTTSEIEIFSGELYQKNPNQRKVQIDSNPLGEVNSAESITVANNENNINPQPDLNIATISQQEKEVKEFEAFLETMTSANANPPVALPEPKPKKVQTPAPRITYKRKTSDSSNVLVALGLTLLVVGVAESYNHSSSPKLKK